jgi:hypothetical protein
MSTCVVLLPFECKTSVNIVSSRVETTLARAAAEDTSHGGFYEYLHDSVCSSVGGLAIRPWGLSRGGRVHPYPAATRRGGARHALRAWTIQRCVSPLKRR